MTLRLNESSPMHYVPGKHQQLGSHYLVDHARCLFVADPGLGKTTTAYMATELLRLTGENVFPAVVLAPYRVADVVWTGEQRKWDAFQDLSVVKVMGDEATRRAALKRAVADIYVINYENVEWLTSLWPQEKWPFRTVIPDESSKLKGFRLNKGGKRAAALSNIAQWTQRWWNLTGTPCPAGLQDLWGQMYFVDFGATLKRSYTAYMEAFFMENPYTHRISPQQGAEAAIAELMKDKMIAFRAEDWLDLTKPQEIPVEYDLSPRAQTLYDDMERAYFLSIDDKDISAGTAMVKSTKLRQIVAGSIYDEETAPHHIHDDRLQALDGVLDQLNNKEQLLVSYWWKTDPPRLMKHLEKLGVKARVYSGQKDEDDWNARKYRVLLLSEAAAFGLNLHEPCRDVFMYTYTWSGELWTQFINRVGPTRQAQAGKKCVVRIWYAKARGTIDSAMVDSNFGKITVEEALKRARAQRYI